MRTIHVEDIERVAKVTEDVGKDSTDLGLNEGNPMLAALFIDPHRLFQWSVSHDHDL